MKEETRGFIEKAIDNAKFGFKDVESYQEITSIKNEEEFLLGYTIGYLTRHSEMILLVDEKRITKADEERVRKIMRTRIPEIRKKLMQYLNR